MVVELKKILIVGGHEQAVLMLEHIFNNNLGKIVACVCREDDHGEDGIFPSLAKAANEYCVPVLYSDDLNSNKFFNRVAEYEADVVLSLQNNRLFNNQWVDYYSNKLGIINIHYSPLPKYAGYWPELWAIWNEEKDFAVTAHYVSNGIDTGDIISQRWFLLDQLETRQSLYRKSTENCYLMLCDLLPDVLVKKVKSTPQNQEERTFYKKYLPEDGVLDLNWGKDKIERFIRAIAFPGFPGPKINIGHSTYTLFEEDYAFFQLVNTQRK